MSSGDENCREDMKDTDNESNQEIEEKDTSMHLILDEISSSDYEDDGDEKDFIPIENKKDEKEQSAIVKAKKHAKKTKIMSSDSDDTESVTRDDKENLEDVNSNHNTSDEEDDEPLSIIKNKSSSGNKIVSKKNEMKTLKTNTKIDSDNNDEIEEGFDDAEGNSDDDTKKDIVTLKQNGDKLKRKRSTSESSDSERSNKSDNGDNENDENKPKKKRKRSNSNADAKESSKMIRLKRYLSISGIKVRNYSTFFEGCKSKKSKEMKLMKLLEDEGLKGAPTIEKCKKLRKKREVKQEISELDLSNIIDVNEGQKQKRTTRNRMKSVDQVEKQKENLSTNKDSPFGNLAGVIDSEESDDGCKNKKKTEEIRIKKRRVIDSDEKGSF
eukprot:gene6894-7672_t